MSAAINILKQELATQQEKLAGVRAESKDTIDAGRRAQDQVDRQGRRVAELDEAISQLAKIEREKVVA